MLVMVWVAIYPRPYGMAIACAAIVPWLAIAMAWMNPGQIPLEEKKRYDTGPTLTFLLSTCPLALSVRAMLDVATVDVHQLILWGFVCGLPLWIAIATAPTARSPFAAKHWGLVLLLMLFTSAYGGGLLALTNAMWDNAKPETFKTVVVDKNVSRGKGTSYYLNLAPWNRTIDENRFLVSRAYYETVHKGDAICVRLYPGKFGLRWTEVGRCS